MRLTPAALTCASIVLRAPDPIATITMTTATPIVIPSSVSAERRRLRPSALTARCSVAMEGMSLVPQRIDRIEAGGPSGGGENEKKSYGGGGAAPAEGCARGDPGPPPPHAVEFPPGRPGGP